MKNVSNIRALSDGLALLSVAELVVDGLSADSIAPSPVVPATPSAPMQLRGLKITLAQARLLLEGVLESSIREEHAPRSVHSRTSLQGVGAQLTESGARAGTARAPFGMGDAFREGSLRELTTEPSTHDRLVTDTRTQPSSGNRISSAGAHFAGRNQGDLPQAGAESIDVAYSPSEPGGQTTPSDFPPFGLEGRHESDSSFEAVRKINRSPSSPLAGRIQMAPTQASPTLKGRTRELPVRSPKAIEPDSTGAAEERPPAEEAIPHSSAPI